MADVVVSKQVFFIGAWRTPKVTDQLLQQISQQMFHKEGYSTVLNLTNDGLYLNISNINGQTTKTDKIPLEIMADFINNKHSKTNTCLLAIVKDGRDQYTVFVFLCRNEKDSAAMVQEFQKLKSKLRGEGYNLDMKQSGTNWTLKNKDTHEEISQPNGDVRIVTTTTTTTTNGVPDSVSHTSMSSDVREEINELAKEVRDIRLQMQKSGGRHHFAKHYGYLSSPPPTQTTVNREVFTEEVVLPPSPVITNDVNYVQRRYVKRAPEQNVILVRNKTGQYKQKLSTSGHFIRAGSTSSIASTVRRRVYPSPNPMADLRYRLPKHVDTVRVMSGGPQPVMLRNSRSDIVHKDIENVYRGRKIYRRIIPVGSVGPVRSETYDYVQAHQQEVIEDDLPVEPVRSVYVDNSPPKAIKRSALHIKYNPNERDLYENTTFHRTNESNVSTLVNVSSNDLLEDTQYEADVKNETAQKQQVIIINGDSSQVRNEYNGEAVTTTYEDVQQPGKVFVVKGDDKILTDLNQTGHENENVYYVKSDTVFNEPDRVVGGGVYHVKAKGLENIEGAYYEAADEPGVVITDSSTYDADAQPSTSNVTVIKTDVNDVQEGMWGAYAKEPEPYDPSQEIEKEIAYRYTDNDNDVTVIESVSTVVNSEASPTDVTDNIADEVEEKRVRYADDLEQTIEDKVDDIEESDIGRQIDDVLDDQHDGIVNEAVDDLNNNAADGISAIKKSDIDIDDTKNNVLDELKGRFNREAESTVLF